MGPVVLVLAQTAEEFPNRLVVAMKFVDVHGVDGGSSDRSSCSDLFLRRGVGRVRLAVWWVGRVMWRINLLPDDAEQGRLDDTHVKAKPFLDCLQRLQPILGVNCWKLGGFLVVSSSSWSTLRALMLGQVMSMPLTGRDVLFV